MVSFLSSVVMWLPLWKNKVFNSLLRPTFHTIFYPVRHVCISIYKHVRILWQRIVAGWFFACGSVYFQHYNRPVVSLLPILWKSKQECNRLVSWLYYWCGLNPVTCMIIYRHCGYVRMAGLMSKVVGNKSLTTHQTFSWPNILAIRYLLILYYVGIYIRNSRFISNSKIKIITLRK